MESSRIAEIKPFLVMDVMERAQAMERDGIHVVHLEVGEPDFELPEPVREAAIRAVRDGKTHYTHSLGLPELREAISRHYHSRYAVHVDPGRILLTNGTSSAMILAFTALLDPGDEVIIADPHYACYPNFIRLSCGVPVPVRANEVDGFQLRSEAVEDAMSSRTRALVINSPSNPAGTMLSSKRMAELASLGLPVVSDEVYHGLVYSGREHSILEFTENAYVLNGFSKAYAMTGLRLGYLIAPPAAMRGLQKLGQNLFICANSVSQWAGIAALEQCGPELDRMRAVYDERRRFMLRRLRDMGFGITVEPTGAFYVLANASRFGYDSLRLAFEILEHAAVGVAPGVDFGAGGEGYLRFSYANSLENIAEGLKRIERFLCERCGRP